jgi:hypothetical protein
MTHHLVEYEDLLKQARGKVDGDATLLARLDQHFDLSTTDASALTAGYIGLKRKALEKFMRREFTA